MCAFRTIYITWTDTKVMLWRDPLNFDTMFTIPYVSGVRCHISHIRCNKIWQRGWAGQRRVCDQCGYPVLFFFMERGWGFFCLFVLFLKKCNLKTSCLMLMMMTTNMMAAKTTMAKRTTRKTARKNQICWCSGVWFLVTHHISTIFIVVWCPMGDNCTSFLEVLQYGFNLACFKVFPGSRKKFKVY